MADFAITPGNLFEIKPNQTATRKSLYIGGDPAYLAGIFADTARLDGTDANGNFKDLQFDHIMNALSNFKNNFFRHYVTNYFLYLLDDHGNPTTKTPTGQDPRERYSPFLWRPKDALWDLTKFNDDYFNRLRAMLSAAQRHHIVVQITLFDGAGMRFNDRWPFNPWNAARNINAVVDAPVADHSAMPTFYHRATNIGQDSDGNDLTLGQIQDIFINKVVAETLPFGNVVYEIMNEPTSGNADARARWADAIVGTINGATKGRRLIFYNDLSHLEDPTNMGGLDVNSWLAQELPNYAALDGVIFHGDPNNVNPDNTRQWKFTADKVIQASSDTADATLREQTVWNQQRTTHCFERQIVFQAEATTQTAASGIMQATPQPPRFINPLPVLGCWDKTAENRPSPAPRFNLWFGANGRYVAFDPVTSQILTQGRIVHYDASSFSAIPQGQTTVTKFAFTLSPDGTHLSYTNVSNGFVQQFVRMPFDFEPFLFCWEKTAENRPSPAPHFFLYFGRNGGALTFIARDAQNQQNIIRQGTVTGITSYPPVIKLLSQQGEVPFSYTFTNSGQNLTTVNLNTSFRQDFKKLF
jgi:hypothetical protein